MAVGRRAHGLQPPRGVAAQRRRRHDLERRRLRGRRATKRSDWRGGRAGARRSGAARLRAWRVTGVTGWGTSRAGPKGGSGAALRPSSGLVHAQREGRQARDPRAREGPRLETLGETSSNDANGGTTVEPALTSRTATIRASALRLARRDGGALTARDIRGLRAGTSSILQASTYFAGACKRASARLR